MKKLILALIFGSAFSLVADWQVFFSPHGGCTDAVVSELAKAKIFVLVQAYSFTSPQIAEALVAAHNRHVAVWIIADKGQKTAKGSEINLTLKSGLPTFIDSRHAIAHNKVIVIDGQTLLNGSFNFTTSAEEHNAENLLINHDPKLAFQYAVNWTNHLNHSEPYAPARPAAAAPPSRGHL